MSAPGAGVRASWVGVASLSAAVVLSASAQAEETAAAVVEASSAPASPALESAPPAVESSQRNLGLLASIGNFQGFGLGAQASAGPVGLRVLGGWRPLVIGQKAPGERSKVHFYSGFQLAPDLYASLFAARSGASGGVTLGYRYHSVVHHGVAVGGYGSFRAGRFFDIFVTGGLMVFPNGNDRLRAAEHLAPDVDLSLAMADFSINAGVALFP